MSWNINWLTMSYLEGLQHRVRDVYAVAHSALEKANREGREKLEAEAKKATDPDEANWTRETIAYEDEHWVEQQEALAAMALALLASLTKAFLDEQKARMNKSHPADPKGYGGKGLSQLVKQVREYATRFKIDLEKIDGFETVREIELARHACLHNGGNPTDDYEKMTKRRLPDEYGRINLKPTQLDEFIAELSRFADQLSNEIQNLQTASEKVNPLGASFVALTPKPAANQYERNTENGEDDEKH